MDTNKPDAADERGGVYFPINQDLAGGLFLVVTGLIFLWQGSDLPMGTLRSVGPGMMPLAVAIMLIAGGAMLAVMGIGKDKTRLPFFSYRGVFFIIGGILIFGFLIRSVGLIAAGPLSMIFASYASRETRIVETTIFSVIMTAFCIFLFKYLLALPIPVVVNVW